MLCVHHDADTDRDRNTDPHADIIGDSDTHPDRYDHDYAVARRRTDGCSIHAQCDGNGNPHSHANGDSNNHTDPHADTHADILGNSDQDSHRYAHRNTDCRVDGYANVRA